MNEPQTVAAGQNDRDHCGSDQPATPAGSPRLRSDLVTSRQGGAFVIKDPASRRFFRFGELEHFIAQQLDGATSPEEVRKRVEEKFSGAISTTTLQQFIDRLRALGLLADERTGIVAPRPADARRIGGNIFYIRFKAFDPDRLFSRWVGRIQFLFTPAFVALSSALIIYALGLTVLNWPEIHREFVGLFRLDSLLVAWVVMLGVITLHEFAHGLTCKHFGGQVHELGFLLLYFQPAFYCNVSDAWLFAEKSKRVWVTFAGAYFEMFLWAISTVIWRLTEPFTTINHLALVVTATSAIRSLFNLNPLIKLDGYYLLSDWLEVPNLRARAFKFLGNLLRRPWATLAGGGTEAPRRERRIYLAYGLLAATYTAWILALVAVNAGSYLTARYEGWGAVLFAVLLTGLFQTTIRRSLWRIGAACRRPSGTIRLAGKLAKATVVVGGLGLALHFWPMELTVSGDFTISPMRNAEVRAEVAGFIEDITRDEGERVKQGEVIAQLQDREVRADLRKLAAEIEENRAQLKLLKAGSRPEEIRLAKTTVAKDEERLKHADVRLQIDRALHEQLLLSRREFNATEEEVAVRQEELEEDKNRLAVLEAGSRAEQIEALEAVVNRGLAQQRYLEEQLRLQTVTSPVAGVITTHRPKEKIGQHLQKGDLIVVVNELDTVTAEIAVSEKDISDVRVGQKVALKARASPQTRFEGTVTQIAPLASDTTDWREQRTILVSTRLDNQSHLLLPRMSGRAKISCGQRDALDLVLRKLIGYLRVEFWSWW